MIISLDISTTCTGIAYFDEEHNDVIFAEYRDLHKIKNDNEFKELIDRAEDLVTHIKNKIQVCDYQINDIIIEEPLKMSNNVNTVIKLARFNAMVSMMLYEVFNIVPNYITVADWRKYGFPGVHCHKGDDKKEIYLKEMMKKYKDFELEYNRNGKIKKEVYDMSDAICIGMGYLNYKSKH